MARRRAPASGDWAQKEPLGGKAALVTGAGTGIGAAIATRLAQLGADVGICYWRSDEGARGVAEEIAGLGRKGVLLRADLGSEEEVRSTVVEAERELGGIDFLVNNAGGAGGSHTDAPIDQADFGDFNRLVASNLGSTFLCSRYVAPIMLRQRAGRIVNISSICGVTGDCGPAYCASKAGVLGLTRHAAVALAPYVQVNAILPGFIDSQAHDAEKVGVITPGRRMGHPSDVADLTGYLLASPQQFLTGACIVLDGAVTSGVIGRVMAWDEARSADVRFPGSS